METLPARALQELTYADFCSWGIENLLWCYPYGFLFVVFLVICIFGILIWRSRNRLTKVALALDIVGFLLYVSMLYGENNLNTGMQFLNFMILALLIAFTLAFLLGIWGATQIWRNGANTISQKTIAIIAILAGPIFWLPLILIH